MKGTRIYERLIAGMSDDWDIPIIDASQMSGGIKVFNNKAERGAWAAKYPSRLPNTVAVVGNGENGFPSWYKWESSKWYFAGYFGGMVLADVDGALTHVDSTAVFSSDFEIHSAGDAGQGVLLALSAAVKADIAKKVTPSAVKKADALHGGETVLGGNTVAPPDEHRHRETSVGCLAYFDQEVMPAGGAGFVWPMNWVYNDMFINLNMRDKEIEINTMPNAPEEAYFLIALRVAFAGTASGNLSYTVSLIDSGTGTVLMDVNSQAMQKNIQPVDGQPYEPALIAGVVRVVDQKKIKIQVVNRFKTDIDIGDRVENVSGILIQELASGHAGGLPLITAQMDMKKRFVTSHRYIGRAFSAMSYQMVKHADLQLVQPDTGGYDSDNWALFVKSKGIQAASDRTGLRVKSYDDPDKRQEFALWCVCHKIVGEELELLKQSGATVTVTAETDQTVADFAMRAIKFVGDVSDVNDCPITNYSDYNVTYAAGYSQLVKGSYTHSVDGRTPEGVKVSFTTPKDADAIVICFGQNDSFREPYDIKIKDITLNADPAGVKWELEVKDQ
ncbi:conserved hypothetical protein [Vibrio phage 237E40-1]|nr:conserved hypothetical protein [Vibrio phage 237E40-1]